MASDGAIIAASLTGIAAIATAYAAIVRAKREGSRECHDQLAAAHREAEELEATLHQIRMKHPEVMEDEERVPKPGPDPPKSESQPLFQTDPKARRWRRRSRRNE